MLDKQRNLQHFKIEINAIEASSLPSINIGISQDFLRFLETNDHPSDRCLFMRNLRMKFSTISADEAPAAIAISEATRVNQVSNFGEQ